MDQGKGFQETSEEEGKRFVTGCNAVLMCWLTVRPDQGPDSMLHRSRARAALLHDASIKPKIRLYPCFRFTVGFKQTQHIILVCLLRWTQRVTESLPGL